MSPATRRLVVIVTIVIVIFASVAAFALISPQASTSATTTSSSSPAPCSQPSGVTRTQLTSTKQSAEVTTFALPKPLKSPNSLAVASDGSVWFGEVALRGVAHLFLNGTLIQYAWPSYFVSSQTVCYDVSELWGLVLWHGMVWATDAANDQLVALNPVSGTFATVQLTTGALPRFLAVDKSDDLWFTESSTRTQVGVLNSPAGTPQYFDVPAGTGQISASILVHNSSLAYVVTVNQSDNAGQVFSFDPSVLPPTFTEVGANQTLLAPYSVALADGGLWLGEHDASDLAFYNQSTGRWAFYPTSVNPEVPLTLPYYLQANGSSVWFNEHDSNKIAVVSGTSALTEYNISTKSLAASGIGNPLTIALSGSTVWFTEWTGNSVGFVNASVEPSFSIDYPARSTVRLFPGSSANATVVISGSSTVPLSLQFADSESHLASPANLTITSGVLSPGGMSGEMTVNLDIGAKLGTPPGQYLVLVTVTDGATYRSVYIEVEVT